MCILINDQNAQVMTVWIATWDVRNQGLGVEAFATRELAVAAAIGYAAEMNLLDEENMPVQTARDELLSYGSLSFPDRECFYQVVECVVTGALEP